jgi:phage gp37-like protein
MIDIILFEESILTALGTIPELKKVNVYQGELAEENIAGLLAQMQMPAALTSYSGAKIDGEQARDAARGNVSVSFTVYVIGKNLRGKTAAAADVRAVLKKVRDALNGLVVGKLMLLWDSEQPRIITNTGVCAYAQTYGYTDYIT